MDQYGLIWESEGVVGGTHVSVEKKESLLRFSLIYFVKLIAASLITERQNPEEGVRFGSVSALNISS